MNYSWMKKVILANFITPRLVKSTFFTERNPSSGDFLVVELKKTKDTPDYVVGQIARYMGWVKTNLCKDKEVFGIIVTQGVSEKLKYAITMLKNCYLAEFELRLEFRKIEPPT